MKKLLLTTMLIAGATMGRAQFTPMGLITLPIDFPGLVTSYTHIAVDANFAASGAPSWSLTESIAVGRDASNMITSTLVTSTYPVEILRANATQSGTVYTSVVEKLTTSWKFHQRETIYSDGTKDTAMMLETYDTTALVYNNSDRWSLTYNGAGQQTQQLHYKWVSGAWALKEKREFTYAGTQYATDTTYAIWGSASGPIWHPTKSTSYFYVAGALDSTALQVEGTPSWMTNTTYHVTTNTSGQVNVIYNYASSGSGWHLSTRTTFDNGSTSTAVNGVAPSASMNIYPVPANELFTMITESGYEGAKVNVFNLAGQSLINAVAENKETHIDVSGLATGAYIVTVEKEGMPALRQNVTVSH